IGLTRTTLGVLVCWVLLLLPVSFWINSFPAEKRMLGWFVLGLYLLAVPLGLRWIVKRLNDFFHERVHLILPEGLRALSCLRTGGLTQELRGIRRFLESQRPSLGDSDADDLFTDLIDYADSEIEECINLASQDPDTVWSEI